jgi:hypothetical protein
MYFLYVYVRYGSIKDLYDIGSVDSPSGETSMMLPDLRMTADSFMKSSGFVGRAQGHVNCALGLTCWDLLCVVLLQSEDTVISSMMAVQNIKKSGGVATTGFLV